MLDSSYPTDIGDANDLVISNHRGKVPEANSVVGSLTITQNATTISYNGSSTPDALRIYAPTDKSSGYLYKSSSSSTPVFTELSITRLQKHYVSIMSSDYTTWQITFSTVTSGYYSFNTWSNILSIIGSGEIAASGIIRLSNAGNRVGRFNSVRVSGSNIIARYMRFINDSQSELTISESDADLSFMSHYTYLL